ncbi:cytochrome c-type biogenesis protein CcmI [Caulobacter sp. AP07]|uniref:c-type cytochrome biogenesis protein CcmI n=1 Tax=Caulobacter sp. AP07 TaxID=1144304 RepID=UPI0002720C4C|nr:c-type cytochrome biogenesis protein CcmI [Caulobacter sp. AP07]EJL29660.1 cytochrome c-type biogenesis protein CcmI [Caulobacter sp. AP07]
MIAFWIAAAGLSAVVAALVLRGAARASMVMDAGGGDDASLAVHRRQLSEIDDLAERGLLADAELKAARAEAGRRLIAAADHQQAWPASGPKARPLVLFAAFLAPVCALAAYLFIGVPGLADQPYLKRVAQWRQTPLSQLQPEQIAAVLQETARAKPNDPQLFRLLALTRFQAGDATGAAQALRHAVRLAPDRVDLWVGLGEVLVAEDQGEVGTDARRAFAEALRRDPANVSARYHLAKGRIADGDLAGGLADWRALLATLPADDPRRAAFGDEIAQTEARGSLAPTGAPSEQAAAPATGDQPEVETFIQGMVASLAARLEANPDDADGWVKLVRAYAVLGDTAHRDAALAKAQARFHDQPKVLAALRQAAQTPRSAQVAPTRSAP